MSGGKALINFLEIPDIVELAPRVIWFEQADQSLQNPVRFLAYAMRYATHEDMATIRKYLTDQDFLMMLDQIPPGIVDGRSWAYWNAVFDRFPTPPMPVRKLG
jgi:hypothetical protein